MAVKLHFFEFIDYNENFSTKEYSFGDIDYSPMV
jgi:hypothetical protein